MDGVTTRSKNGMPAIRRPHVESLERDLRQRTDDLAAAHLNLEACRADLEDVRESLLGLSIDITEQRAATERLRLAQLETERASRAKSDFLSRMSHDLRTPLNAILGFAQILQMDTLTPDQTEGGQQSLRGGGHLLDLINEVLDIARIEVGQLSLSPEPVPVEEVVTHVVSLVRPLATRRRITITNGQDAEG